MSETGATTMPVNEVPAAAADRPDRTSRTSYGRTAKVGALWAFGAESIAQLIALPTAVILARLLTPEEMGIAAAATFFIQLAKKIGGLGLNTAVVRIRDLRPDHLSSVFVVNMAVSLLSWAALMVAAPWLAAFYDDSRVTGAIQVGAIVFLANFFGAVEFGLLRRDMKFKQMAFIEWVGPTLFLVISVTMAWRGWGFWSLIWSQVIANLGVTAAKLYFGRWRPSLKCSRRGFAETLPFGLGIYGKRLLTFGAQNLDSLIVGGLFGVTALGFYDKAYNTSDKMVSRLSLGPSVMFRIFAIIQEDRARFARAYAKVILTATLATLPVFAGLIVAAREFIVVAFEDKWLPAVLPFQLLCAAGALRVVLGYGTAAIQAGGRVWSELWRSMLYVALVLGLVYSLRGWGIEGAAFAVVLATLVSAVLMQALVRELTGLTWSELMAPMVPGLLAAAGTALVVGGITVAGRTLQVESWVLLIGQAAGGAAFWLLFTLFARFATLQGVIDEVVDDMLPAVVRRKVDWLRRRPLPSGR